jgi:protein-tyrosine-phosphatase/DNA-binding transcriptional ArsR family regulator
LIDCRSGWYRRDMTTNVASPEVDTKVDADVDAGVDAPPGFVQLVAHPVRWRLLRELVRSDLAVRELTERVGERQSLVSYHLRQLGEGGLVVGRRSSADRRDTYYRIELATCEQRLQATGAALHPALLMVPMPLAAPAARRSLRPPRVLFLCTGNSARSQIAEALIIEMSNGAVEAASAGSHPKPLHPNAVRAMRERGVDIGANRTKHLDEFLAWGPDMVVTLCDRVREVCPDFPGGARFVHWSMADPSLEGATDRASYPAFERTAAELETRIRYLLPLLSQRRPSEQASAQRPKGRSKHAPR